MDLDYRPKLAVDITEEHKQKLDKYLGEWGRKKEVVFVILEDLFRLFDKYGADVIIGALVERAISLKEICKLEVRRK